MVVAEFTWTLIPVIILALVGLHSLDMLYSTWNRTQWTEIFGLVVKVWAHQWYWSYEYSDMTSSRYDSYIKPHCILELGDYRVLEVDYRAIVPTAIDAILVVTSDDLLHSFTIPTISVKIDAIPARLNARILVIVIPGLYYGGFDIEGSSINDLYSSSMTCNIGCTILYGGYFNTSSIGGVIFWSLQS